MKLQDCLWFIRDGDFQKVWSFLDENKKYSIHTVIDKGMSILDSYFSLLEQSRSQLPTSSLIEKNEITTNNFSNIPCWSKETQMSMALRVLPNYFLVHSQSMLLRAIDVNAIHFITFLIKERGFHSPFSSSSSLLKEQSHELNDFSFTSYCLQSRNHRLATLFWLFYGECTSDYEYWTQPICTCRNTEFLINISDDNCGEIMQSRKKSAIPIIKSCGCSMETLKSDSSLETTVPGINYLGHAPLILAYAIYVNNVDFVKMFLSFWPKSSSMEKPNCTFGNNFGNVVLLFPSKEKGFTIFRVQKSPLEYAISLNRFECKQLLQ